MNHCDPYSSKIGLTVLFYANKSKYQKLTVLQKYPKKISKKYQKLTVLQKDVRQLLNKLC